MCLQSSAQANGEMTISFMARDASGRTIADQSAGISLQPVNPGMNYGRRLSANDSSSIASAGDMKEQGFLSKSERRPERRLSSRRRSSFSSSRRRSYTDSRRRTMSSPRRRVASPRRRAVLDTRRRTSAVTSPRRRATSVSYSRRRSISSSDRRRRSSFTSNYYSNPSHPNMGKYGYANQNYAYQNYGGHMPMTTPYGYSGANAYQGGSGSGMKIALAGGAGLLAGIAANKLMHHWGGYSREQIMNAPCSTGVGPGAAAKQPCRLSII